MNYRLTAYVLGEILVIVGALMCIPMFMALGYHEENTVFAFGITIAVAVVLGAVGIMLRPPKDKRNLRPQSGFVMCGLAWILLALIGAMPFRISGAIPHYIDALFETISGFTTTGSSILTADLVNPETGYFMLPKSILFWRALTQWIGGMGVLVFVIAVLPKNDKASTALAKAEIPGYQFGKLVGKLRFTSQILYAMYIVLTLILVGILCACKMPVFDSFCHAFSTASTGGFSVMGDSIGGYHSVAIEVVITVFMLIFSVNFNLYYMILIGHFKSLKNEELFTMASVYVLACVAIVGALVGTNTLAFDESVRHTTFNVASMMSTTGYGTGPMGDFTHWPTIVQVMLLLIMCVGGSAGSTAGGMKMSRAIILVKSSANQVRRLNSPRSVRTVKMDGKALPDSTVEEIQNFFIIYILIMVFSTVLLAILSPYTGAEGIATNLSAVISCLNNIGPGVGAVGPCGNFAGYDILSKIVLMFDMLIGRLEIIPILMLFYYKSWKRA